ncbi:MAG: nuclear transport factor 2 family protein [Gracilimonas sp.]|uniref:nuclear transport factor 2 family protein n=1 Tax=Gracilimonas sp. TaxID=1974203 RepID=UPI0019A091DA|nr:nuclear transport factor 2 family protein [Gracilimonas sp.]MBD3616566.1 nuclear transport factor 2 family protein [Gracilimonas sp.]
MNENEKLIHRLYSGLEEQDYETMTSCYHPNAVFRDAVFDLKSKQEIAGMWTMLCKGAKEFEFHFDQVWADEETGKARLKAKYLFSQTNRMVHNNINARFRFKDGLIIEHIDSFDFRKWSRQALGLQGFLLGWSSFLQKKVQQQALNNMKAYIPHR